jgi:hypothetical protein
VSNKLGSEDAVEERPLMEITREAKSGRERETVVGVRFKMEITSEAESLLK